MKNKDNFSSFVHYDSYFVAMRQDFWELCEGDTTAAYLLSWMEFKRNGVLIAHADDERENAIRVQVGKPPLEGPNFWVTRSFPDFVKIGMGLFKLHAARKAVEYLLERGFLERRNHPDLAWVRTYQYRLNVEAVQAGLDQLAGRYEGKQTPTELADEAPIVHPRTMHNSSVNDYSFTPECSSYILKNQLTESSTPALEKSAGDENKGWDAEDELHSCAGEWEPDRADPQKGADETRGGKIEGDGSAVGLGKGGRENANDPKWALGSCDNENVETGEKSIEPIDLSSSIIAPDSPRRKLTVQQEKRKALQAEFERITNRHPIGTETSAQMSVRWWRPLDFILRLAGGDVGGAAELIRRTERYMGKKGLGRDCPGSYERVAAQIKPEMERGGRPNRPQIQGV